jgi:hypothetical protein
VATEAAWLHGNNLEKKEMKQTEEKKKKRKREKERKMNEMA